MRKCPKPFTRDDVRAINRSLMTGQSRDHSMVSPASQRILSQSTFTRDEINDSFAAARGQREPGGTPDPA